MLESWRRSCVRRSDRRAQVDLPQRPGERRIRRRHVARKCPRVGRRRPQLERADNRRAARHRVYPVRNGPIRFLRRQSPRRKPVRQQSGCARCADGQKTLALSGVHHDLWDYDLPAAPKLLTIRHDGRNVDVVAQPTKHGFVFVFDRATGAPLWPIEERPVPQTDVPGEKTWPTQPFPTAPPPFARQKFTEADINPYLPDDEQAKLKELLRSSRNEGLYTPPSLKGTIELPGHNGGANWGSSAIDPDEGHDVHRLERNPDLHRS